MSKGQSTDGLGAMLARLDAYRTAKPVSIATNTNLPPIPANWEQAIAKYTSNWKGTVRHVGDMPPFGQNGGGNSHHVYELLRIMETGGTAELSDRLNNYLMRMTNPYDLNPLQTINGDYISGASFGGYTANTTRDSTNQNSKKLALTEMKAWLTQLLLIAQSPTEFKAYIMAAMNISPNSKVDTDLTAVYNRFRSFAVGLVDVIQQVQESIIRLEKYIDAQEGAIKSNRERLYTNMLNPGSGQQKA